MIILPRTYATVPKYKVKIKAVSCLGKESSFLQSDYMF